MDPLFVLVFVILAGGAAVWFSVQQGDRKDDPRIKAWRDVAASCGLQEMEIFGHSGFKARAGPLEVKIAKFGEESSGVLIEILVPGSSDFYNVRIRPESFMPAPWVREIEIGDKSFDNAFSIEGSIPLVRALLDAEMRRLLAQANSKNRLEISYSKLQTEASDEELPLILPLLIDLGQRLAQPVDIPRRLAENAKQDPEAKVRLQNLLLLIREFPRDPIIVEALRTACSDPSHEIRLRAAKELGTERRDVLFELAEIRVDDAVSAQAISILDRELPFERVTIILDRALDGRRLQTARACLEALSRSGSAAAVEPLAKALAREKGELATIAAQALGMTGSAAAESPLILALQHENEDVHAAAASALGRVGSAAAVLPLKELADRSWLDLNLRQATRQSIAEIQSRLSGASPGQLSLAEAEAGQLSLASEQGGQLSLASGEPGQLSLSGEEKRKPPSGT